jgi:hypothetical protein
MRHSKLQIFKLDNLSNGIAYLWTVVNYVLNLAPYSLKPSAMPIHSDVECIGVTSGNFYRSQINYSRNIAFLKMPSVFWH